MITKMKNEQLRDTFDNATIAVIGSLTLVALSLIYPITSIFREPKISESKEGRIFYSSLNTGPFRGYDLNRTGLLDKVEESSFSYRPSHLSWHKIKSNSDNFRRVQAEYQQALKLRREK